MNTDPRDIAVIGLAVNVPGAVTKNQLWENLMAGRDCLTRSTEQDLSKKGVPWSRLRDPRFRAVYPSIRDRQYFDTDFFDMPPFEAEQTAISHRLFLQCAQEAFEDAAIVPKKSVKIGVFAGTDAAYLDQTAAFSSDPVIRVPMRIGGAPDFISARTAYKFNLRGPSFTMLSACATSLVATHIACRSLQEGECDVAIVGGSLVWDRPRPGYLTGLEGMISESGWIRPFDARADGTIFGEGVAVVVLRGINGAIRDGNPIYALVKGTAVTNDGNPESKNTFIAPALEGQTAAIQGALDDADIGAETIGYVEAHGTGTLLGDPVEVRSLAKVYQRYISPGQRTCAIGSIKGNLGHLGPTAGVISLAKACLALKYGKKPPLANFSQPNPHIQFEKTPFFINSEPLDWQPTAHPRRAAVSAFGFGGSNAHVILEAYDPPPPPEPTHQTHLLPISAKSRTALRRRKTDLADHLAQHPGCALADIAHTLQSGRTAMPCREVLIHDDSGRASAEPITRGLSGTKITPGQTALIFLFPGQGAQRPGMGRALYRKEPTYRTTLDECAGGLEKVLGLNILNLIHADPTGDASADSSLKHTAMAQPALFAVEYALARLYLSWGFKPDVLLGHSVGELVAACLAEVFSLQDGLKIVAARSRLMQACEPGAMAAVFMAADDLELFLPEQLTLAARNAPELCVVSGPISDMDVFLKSLGDDGIAYSHLETSHAFHSWMMDPVLPEFKDILAGIRLRPPSIPVLSNVTGEPLTASQAQDPAYWSQHIRHAVEFSGSVRYLLTGDNAPPNPVFLEIGPGRGLSDLVRRHNESTITITTLTPNSSEAEKEDAELAIEAAARVWCNGIDLDWSSLTGLEKRRKLSLPTYPFQRRPFPLAANKDDGTEPECLFLSTSDWARSELEPVKQEPADSLWLILCDDTGLGDNIAARLAATGVALIKAYMGTACNIGRKRCTLRPGREEDLHVLITLAVKAAAGRALKVLHLWTLTDNAENSNSARAFTFAKEGGFFTLLELVKAAAKLNAVEGLDILAVTSGLAQVDGEDRMLRAENAALLGPCRVLPKELKGLKMRCIDVPPYQKDADTPWLEQAVLKEAAHGGGTELMVALRPQGRYIEEMYALPALPLSRMRLRNGGTVLITGGVGGLGLKVAEMLFETAGARLVLGSRWAPPPRDKWLEHLTKSDKIGRALRVVTALEKRGAKIEIRQMDMTDSSAVSGAIEWIRSEFGGLHGVVHAAGVVRDEPAMNKTLETADAVFAPKVLGALHLEEALKEQSLDFCVYFSSQASCFPGPGRIDYTAANAVLDVLARERARHLSGLNCSIAWGAWFESGMANDLAKSAVDKGAQPMPVAFPREGNSTSCNHPIMHERLHGKNGAWSYRGIVKPGQHWVTEHSVRGQRLLSGTTIVFLIYSTFVDQPGNDGAVEISKLALLRPLLVEADGAEIEIVYTPDATGAAVEVRSRTVGKNGTWIINAMGFADRCVTKPQREPDLMPETVGVSPAQQAVGKYLDVGPRWKNEITFKKFAGLERFQIRLNDHFTDDLEDYGIHPALFDTGVGAAVRKHFANPLPVSYDSIRIYNRLTSEIYVYGRSYELQSDIKFDLRYADLANNTLMEIDGYVVTDMGASSLTQPEPGANQRLVVAEAGNLDSIKWVDTEVKPPANGEIQVEVVAAGLNFRDVLVALDQLPATDGPPRIGSECSGFVRAVGAGVTRFKEGDPVMCAAVNALATRVCVSASSAVIKPGNLSFEEAAGIPITYLTVAYSLLELAKLKPGERILIHAATGGVGLAAVQIARRTGAEIYATAGRPEKRQYLRDLGIDHVMDSRSLDFVKQVESATDGKGVDVVLNSLAGEFIPASLKLLKRFGRFIEIGKRDILSDTELGLYPFRNNLTYHAVDLGQMIGGQHPGLKDVFWKLAHDFQRGELKANPTVAYSLESAAEGFKHLARANHLGKVVIKIRNGPETRHLSYRKFCQQYGAGIEDQAGIYTLKLLLSSDTTPPFVLVTADELDAVKARRKTDIEKTLTKDLSRDRLGIEYVPPHNEPEKRLVKIWEEVLGLSPIGIDDSFISLGGDSISAIQIQFAVDRGFGQNLSMSAIFECATIRELASLISRSEI